MKHPLSGLKTTDIATITLDYQDDIVTTKVFVPVGVEGELAEYEESFGEDDLPSDVRAIALQLGKSLLEHMKKRTIVSGEVRCKTCRGACCYTYDAVHLTPEDIRELTKWSKIAVKNSISPLDKPTIAGHVAVLKKKKKLISGKMEDGACVYLESTGCSIYEHRPTVCREYSAWTCEDTYEADRTKIGGKVKLRVIT